MVSVCACSVAYVLVSWTVLVLSYVVEEGRDPRSVLVDLAPSGLHVLPFAVLGYFLGRLYLSLGPAVMLLIIVPILVAREMFASYLRVKESHDETVQLLVRALEPKDPYTAGHAERVAEYAGYIGEELDFTPAPLERLRFAALMHDIGKLVVPNHLLNKPGKLTEEEFTRVRIHEDVSVQMLSHIDFLRPIAAARAQRRDAVRSRRPRPPDRAVHRHGRRRVRRHDVDPFVPQGAPAGGRVPGAPRQVGHAVPPRVRRGADPRDREARRGARRGPRGGVALRGRARGRARLGRPRRPARRDEPGEASEPQRRIAFVAIAGVVAGAVAHLADPIGHDARWCSSRPASCSASCSCCGSRTARRCRCRTRCCSCSRRRSRRRVRGGRRGRGADLRRRCGSPTARRAGASRSSSTGSRSRPRRSRCTTRCARSPTTTRPSPRCSLALGVAAAAQLPVDLAARWVLRLHPTFSPGRRLAWLAIASSGMLMAIGYRGVGGTGQVGIWGPLLFSTPLLAAWYSFERLDSATRAYRQTIDALAMAPEFGGLVPPGHSQRVAALSVGDGGRARRVGRRHDDLEMAALLHHLGQVTLDEPDDPTRAIAPSEVAASRARCCARSSRSRARATSSPARRLRRRPRSRCRSCGSRATTTTSPRATATTQRSRSRRSGRRRATSTTRRCSHARARRHGPATVEIDDAETLD